jgi:hypothetical protein
VLTILIVGVASVAVVFVVTALVMGWVATELDDMSTWGGEDL